MDVSDSVISTAELAAAVADDGLHHLEHVHDGMDTAASDRPSFPALSAAEMSVCLLVVILYPTMVSQLK
jgi:hypothetical protein